MLNLDKLADQRKYVGRFNLVLLWIVTVWLVILAIICGLQRSDRPQIWFLVLVALGAIGVGSIAGFLFSTFGDEEKAFSQSMTVLNGLIGGFAIADLSKDDSMVLKFFQSLAASVGAPDGGGVLFAITAGFGAIGFLGLYVNKKVMLNPLTRLSNDITNARAVMLGETGISNTEPGETPRPQDPETEEASRTLVKAAPLSDDASQESLMALAKAQYLQGDAAKAIETLRRILVLRPADTDALFYLGQALLTADQPLSAIQILEQLSHLPKAPLLTWKLLGYAYLFDTKRLDDSLQATRKYRVINPDDLGARLNEACVYGQRGPDDPVNVKTAVDILSGIFLVDPAWRRRVVELTEKGEDFAAWPGTKEFDELMAPGRSARPVGG